jgi:NAD(P)H dehydrogenase (quinone)
VIAVTGATGVVGAGVARRLAACGVPQRLVVRDPARAPMLPGAEVRHASSYGAAGEMRAALEGAETLFLVSGEKSLDRVRQHEIAVDAAVAAGVRHIVYLSFCGAAADATFTRAVEHWETEEHIRASPASWTFLRTNLHLDLVPTMVGRDGVIRGPAGNGRLAAVARADVSAAAAAVLVSGGHEGRTYDLTGPVSFSLEEAADRLAEATGKPVRYAPETDEEAFASRAGPGIARWIIEGWVSSYWAIRDGVLAGVSGAVRELTGCEPMTLERYLAAGFQVEWVT